MTPEEIRRLLEELRDHQTELKKKNEELLRIKDELDASRTRYFNLFDLAPEGCITLSEQGLLLGANITAANMLGLVLNDLTKQHLSTFIPKEDQESYFLHHKKIFATGEPQTSELRMLKKDGTEFWARIDSTIVQDADGGPVCRVAMSDITERKRAEEALRFSELKFRTLYDSTGDAVMLLDETGFFDCNKATQAIFGFSTREEFCHMHPASLSPPQQPCGTDSMVLANQKIMTAMEKGSIHFEWMHKRNDTGAIFPADVLLTAMELDGKPVIQAVVRDISERKKVEEALKDSEKRYKNFVENSFSGVYVVQDGRFAYLNNYAVSCTGYEPEEIIGIPSFSFVHPEDRVTMREKSKKMLSGEDLLPYEFRIITKDNNIRWLMETVSPISFKGRPAILGNCVDVTERRQREVLELHSQKLESVGQLAAGIAHEINTPVQFVGDNIHFIQDALQDILSLTSMLDGLQDIDSPEFTAVHSLIDRIRQKEEEIDLVYLKEEIPKAIRQSLEGLQRVSRIVQAMREFSHPGGKDMTDLDINKAIESTITLTRNEWKYSADLSTDLTPDLPIVKGYPADFNQVILNIIINAAQALQEKVGKEASEKGRIEISTRRDGDEVEICIRDTGPGIPPEAQARVFDPFFTTKEVGKGTGQGLAIARNIIVHKHGGKIYFETNAGEGTGFFIRLPLEKE